METLRYLNKHISRFYLNNKKHIKQTNSSSVVGNIYQNNANIILGNRIATSPPFSRLLFVLTTVGKPFHDLKAF